MEQVHQCSCVCVCVCVQALHPGQPHTAVTELLDKYTRLQRRKANRQAALAKAAAAAGGGAGGAQGAGDAAGAAGALESLGSRLCAVSDGTIPLLSGLPMRGLLRCAHIHEVRPAQTRTHTHTHTDTHTHTHTRTYVQGQDA